MQIKRALDQALIKAGVPFLFGCYASDVLVDESGKPAGVIFANRSGRQAVMAGTIIDATPEAVVARLAGARFASFQPGEYEFRRVVIGGEAVAGADVVRRDPPLHVRAEDGTRTPLIEYRLRLPMPEDSWAARAEAEQLARDRTWTPDVRDAAETLFFVPPNPIGAHASLAGLWPGAAKAELGAFRPAGVEALWVLGPYAAVDRTAVPAMMAPAEFVALGARVGAAAAAEAKRRGPIAGRLRPALAQPAPAASHNGPVVRMVSPDAVPRWAGLPRLAVDAAALTADAEFDTVVGGGGTGGAPAGIGAARQGARTLAIEALHGLGGVGTWGQIASYYHGYRKGFTEEIDQGVAALGGGPGRPIDGTSSTKANGCAENCARPAAGSGSDRSAWRRWSRPAGSPASSSPPRAACRSSARER